MANHILIGLGGTGYKVLREFRKRLWAEYPDMTARNKLPIRFLYIDSDEDSTPSKLAGNPDLRVNGQDTAITPDEYLGIKNVNLENVYGNLQAYPGLRHVIGNGEFLRSCMGEVGKAAGQKRRAGRILFAQNAKSYLDKVRHMINSLSHHVGDDEKVNIYIFTGLAGGTGSGSIVDAVSILLSEPQLQTVNLSIEVFAMIPENLPPTGADAGRYHANGYAALSELSALNVQAFLPADVISGKEHIKLNFTETNKQFALTVYTNRNRRNAVVDSYTVLPQLLADVINFRIFTPFSEKMHRLNMYFKSENRPDYVVEYSTATPKERKRQGARTKAVGSFGIKRVSYPNEKLIAVASESIARDAIKMFLYQNFDSDLGYINESKNESKDYNEYLSRENLRNWKLSEADLSFDTPILTPSDGRIPPSFHNYWETVSNDYDYNTARDYGQPLQVQDTYFEDRYKGETIEDAFREEKGVEDYFVAKSRDQVLSESANVIVDKIRKNLFNQWQQGVYSAHDVRQIAERILNMLRNKIDSIEAEAQKLEDKIAICDEQRKDLLKRYSDIVFLIGEIFLRRRRNIYVEYSHVLVEKYDAKTKLASLNIFQRVFLPKLLQQFTKLLGEIQEFVGLNQELIDHYGTMIDKNTPASEPDLRMAHIEVADLDRLHRFISDVLHDRDKMNLFGQKIRDYLAEGTKKSFERVGEKMRDLKVMEEMSVNELRDVILSYHKEMLRHTPVLGLNVVEQLYQMYGHNEDAIRTFASDLVRNSEVYINLDDQEVTKMMPNNEDQNPNVASGAAPNTVMVVALPQINTDDGRLRDFIENLRLKIGQAFPQNNDTRELIFMDSPKADEITILTYQNLFPIRAIDYMPFLRHKYEELTMGRNETTNISNKILLHAEGDGSKLPPLFGEGTGPSGDEVIKFIFLATALGVIKQGEDELGNKGWGLIETDDFGVEMFQLLSPSFTGILKSQELTPERIGYVVERVDEETALPIHVNKKAELAQKVKDLMKNNVLPEAGSPSSELYRRYAAKATEALKVFA